ncbi:MAG: hypothetical protein ACJA1A_002564 [Saprospiraceae bacterium]|jgi:uncharacterized protein YgiM (DUF1202 family)|tara:strand:+ start:2402 stop:2896 length:495 start_codon:yes stop_codon:yes gene_type:complete
MGYKNKKRKKESNNGKYILPLLFFILTFWLLLASIKDKSPTSLLGDVFGWVLGKDSTNPNKAELRIIIDQKSLTIDSLSNTIEELQNKSPYRTAIVNTAANELNLRSQPNLSSEVVIKIPDSSAVKILYFDEEVLILEGETGKWCKIRYADKEGWVWGNYLLLE